MSDGFVPMNELTLNSFWNELVRPTGAPVAGGGELDPAMAETIRRVQAFGDTPPPASSRERVREEVRANVRQQLALRKETPVTDTAVIERVYPPPRQRTWEEPTRPTWLRWPKTNRKWAIAQLAAAVLIIMAIAGGYFIYEGRNEQPAVVLQPATPEATPSGAWTNNRGNAARTGEANQGPLGAPFEHWRFQAGGPCDPPPAVVDGVVYAACGDGNLYALDAASGGEIWRFAADGPLSAGPTVAGQLAYIVDNVGTLYAIDVSDGSEQWRNAGPVLGSPAVSGSQVVVTTPDSQLIAFDRESGAEQWRYRMADQGDGDIPAVANGMVYAGNDSGRLVALDAATGELVWDAATGDQLTGSSVVAGGIVYIANDTDTGALHAYDAATGDELWAQAERLFGPSVSGDTGYAGSAVGTIFAFDAATGAERWRVQIGGPALPAAIADGVLYVPSDGDASVYALDADSGAELWQFELDAGMAGGVAVADGVLYVTTRLGSVYAIAGSENAIAAPGANESPDATPGAVATFNEPFYATLDSQGNLYVADSGNNRIVKFDPTGTMLATFGDTSGPGQLQTPNSVVIDAEGNLYVSTNASSVIQKFDASGEFLLAFGEAGSGEGQLGTGSLIGAIDSQGRLWITDYANHRIQVFDDQGQFLFGFAEFGREDGQLDHPNDLALDADGNVYVAECDGHRVSKFAPDGTFLFSWEHDFLCLAGIDVDAQGHVYVADPDNQRIQVFDTAGNFLTMWGSAGDGEGQFMAPIGITVDDQGNAWVVDIVANRVQKFHLPPELRPGATPVAAIPDSVKFLWASTGGPDPLGFVIDLAIHPDGTIWVVDAENDRIQILDADGAFIETWSGSEDSPLNFGGIPGGGLAIDSTGNIYISELANSQVKKYDPDRNFVMAFGARGVGDGQFQEPLAIAVDADGNIYVGDGLRNDVQKFDANGQYLMTFGSGFGAEPGQLNGPSFIDLDADGNLYVAEHLNDRVSKFAPDGTFLATFGSPGTDDGEFQNAEGVSVDAAGNMYVSDSHAFRVQALDPDGNFLMAFGSQGSGEGEFLEVDETALDGQGNIYVTDATNKRVQKFRLPASLQAGQPEATSVAAGASEPVEQLWTVQGGDGGFDNPDHLAVDPDGRLWVVDTGNGRFQIFDPDGTYVESWGGDGQFQFRRTNGDGYGFIGFAPNGSFYVLDPGNYRVQQFAADRTFLRSIGGFGGEPGQFQNPIGLAVDRNGTVWVVDETRNDIQHFGQNGQLLGAFAALDENDAGPYTINGLGIDEAGNLYVSAIPGLQVIKLSPTGERLATFGEPGTGDGQFTSAPEQVAVDASGRLFVAAGGPSGERVSVYGPDGQFIASLGGDDAFHRGIALDNHGGLYVAAYEANTISKYRLLPPLGPEATPTA